ncbi:hypothetical protein BXZ70DRAFT_1064400 [Cristinia sonorae]|uniref:Lytic polysaccharide monooxygenase n=1 Tax=Cristinia sonorae TaxID=1940300 RepID=A0A8K0UNX4_9AGAR|nr:hypothetical protein BXZ70DRAFT_1064400 [Cristinia sonorae]
MIFILLAFIGSVQVASAHISIWHPSMWGFNVTDKSYPYDNRPVTPLADYTFDQWWFHGHLDHPPHKEDVFELPAGQTVTTELACNKGATSFFASSEGGDIRQGDNPCPNAPMSEYHTNGPDDLKGCSLAIAYKSDVTQVQPEDFTVFSVNHTCVFHRFTDFQVPAAMPPCPKGGCICAWFWIHSEDSGSEQNYMNGFQCNITGSTSNVALAKPEVARRCGADPKRNKMEAAPGNCTYGAKQPFYWFQKERNNVFEDQYAPPFYLDLYNFKDGAQDDIFQNSYPGGLPSPSPNSTFVPTPVIFGAAASATIDSGPSSSPLTPSSPSSSSVSSSPQTTTEAAPAAPPSAQVSVIVSTSVVLTTQVVTVTASVPAITPTPTAAPVISTAAAVSPSASSTVTEYSFQFVTVTAALPGVPSAVPSVSSVESSPPVKSRDGLTRSEQV